MPPGTAAGNRYGTLLFTPCTLSAGGAAGNIEAQCASLRVPENPAAPSGRSIALKIAWLESEAGGGSAPDPVFFIAGGPGQSATEVAAIVILGMVGYFAGVVRAPLTAVIILSETTVSRGLMLPMFATAFIADSASQFVCREKLYHGLSKSFAIR